MANQANKDTPAANAKAQDVWSAKYIDSPVLRDRDADDDTGTSDLGKTVLGLEERLYYQTDANFNVTGVVNATEELLYCQNDANWNVTGVVDGVSESPTEGEVVERYFYPPPTASVRCLTRSGTRCRAGATCMLILGNVGGGRMFLFCNRNLYKKQH